MYGGDLWLLIEGSRCSAAAAARYPAQTAPPAPAHPFPAQQPHTNTHGPIFLLFPDLNVNLGLVYVSSCIDLLSSLILNISMFLFTSIHSC